MVAETAVVATLILRPKRLRIAGEVAFRYVARIEGRQLQLRHDPLDDLSIGKVASYT
jgi:hypothetical protein